MPKIPLLKMKSIHIVYLNKKIEIDMGLQISLDQNENKKQKYKKEHIWNGPSNQSGPSITIKILGCASTFGPSSFSTQTLLSMLDTICWKVFIDYLVLLLVIGPCIGKFQDSYHKFTSSQMLLQVSYESFPLFIFNLIPVPH